MPDNSDDDLVECFELNGQTVTIRSRDIPAKDITTVHGIRCTTPIRTLIDLAPEIDREELDALIDDSLARGLFTVADARARIAEPDMRHDRGATLLGAALPGSRKP